MFDPWQEATWDVNDTVLIDKPNDDPDVGGFFAGLDPSAYLPTWYAARESGDLGAAEQSAAPKTAVHAATPSIAHADALGRPFLTIAHNRFERGGADGRRGPHHAGRCSTSRATSVRSSTPTTASSCATTSTCSAPGALDAAWRPGSAGCSATWPGKPVCAWDSRGQRLRTDLRRAAPAGRLAPGRRRRARAAGRPHGVRGGARPDPRRGTCAGRTLQHLDQAGVVTNEAYDFKGNLLATAGSSPTTTRPRSTGRRRRPSIRGVRHPHELRRAEPSRRGHVARRQCRVEHSSTLRGCSSRSELQLNGATAPTPSSPGSTTTPRAGGWPIGYGNGVRTATRTTR